MARTRFSPRRAGPIASACGGYSSSIPCFFKISTIRGSRPRSTTRIAIRCEAVCIKVLGGAARQRQEDGTDRAGRGARPPVLMYEAQLPHEVELVVVDMALRNLAVFHLVDDAPPDLDPVPGGGKDTVPALFQRPLVEAMAERPFVRSRDDEFDAHPISLSKTVHALPREIRKGLAPRLKSFLNRLATLTRSRQVRRRHDDVVHVEAPQMVPVLVVDGLKRGVNHAKVLLEAHSFLHSLAAHSIRGI